MNDCIERINLYLRDDSTNNPLFVNVENAEQKSAIYDHFNVGSNAIIHISDFAQKDSLPNIMGLLDNLKKSQVPTFVFGVTSYLRLISNQELSKTLQTLCYMSVHQKIVIICFHCEDILKALIKKDLRVAHRVITGFSAEGLVRPKVTLVSKEFTTNFKKVIEGIEFLPEAIEDCNDDEIFVKTSKNWHIFSNSSFAVSGLSNSLQLLQIKYPELKIFVYNACDDEYWNYLLRLSDGYSNFKKLISDHFGSDKNYEYALQEWETFDDKKKWLLFIAMKVYPNSKDEIICEAVKESDSHRNIMRNIVRSILNYSFNDKKFKTIYNQWKTLRNRLMIVDEEINDYCEFVDQKGKDALYYLTDLTTQEKEKAIKLIGIYESNFTDEELLKLLAESFPDFYNYVVPFYFDNKILDKYFSQYAMQKLRNVIYPEFEALVKQEAIDQHYVELPSRSEIVGEFDKNGSIVYFVDALGVEFMNYILKKCADKELFAVPRYGKCNLPSITDVNKEFIKEFKACGAEVIDNIKQIDKDKHEAKGDYNFTKTKFPIHLIDELETIDRVLSDIVTKLDSNKYSQAFIISDHGASRLAVLKKSILPIESNRTGTHGGRVCENNELTKDLPNAIHEGNLCILAEYDRFDGSRPASVETHGGATLEEVVVPIIRITQNNVVWDFKIMNESNKVMFSYKTEPELIIWSKNELTNLVVKQNDKFYNGIPELDKKTFKFKLDKPEKSCDCSVDIYVSNNCVKSDVRFRIEREGMQKNRNMTFDNTAFGGFKK